MAIQCCLIASSLDYCNTFYIGLPLKSIYKFKLVENAAARFLAGINCRDYGSFTAAAKLFLFTFSCTPSIPCSLRVWFHVWPGTHLKNSVGDQISTATEGISSPPPFHPMWGEKWWGESCVACCWLHVSAQKTCGTGTRTNNPTPMSTFCCWNHARRRGGMLKPLLLLGQFGPTTLFLRGGLPPSQLALHVSCNQVLSLLEHIFTPGNF